MTGQLALAVVLLLANAFFVGAEFSLISARRTRIEPLAESGSRRARIVLRGMEQISVMLAGAQLGITVASLGLGAVAEPALEHLLHDPLHALGLPSGAASVTAFAIGLAIVVFCHMVLGEMVPKNIALAGPEESALWLTPPLWVFSRVTAPILWFLGARGQRVPAAVPGAPGRRGAQRLHRGGTPGGPRRVPRAPAARQTRAPPAVGGADAAVPYRRTGDASVAGRADAARPGHRGRARTRVRRHRVVPLPGGRERPGDRPTCTSTTPSAAPPTPPCRSTRCTPSAATPPSPRSSPACARAAPTSRWCRAPTAGSPGLASLDDVLAGFLA
ncbi:CNNM domain-containing protein [Yinghuangia aomiensis]